MIMIDVDEEKLDQYIDEVLIPSYAIGMRKNIEGTLDEYYEMTIYKSILETKFSEDELEYVFHALDQRNIKVTGVNGLYYSAFDNYHITNQHSYRMLPKTMSDDELQELFQEYQKTKDIAIRNKIVEQNLPLAYYISTKYELFYGFDAQEIMSYGVEGLLFSIEKYQPGQSAFSSYAGKYIEGYIKDGIVQLNHFKGAYLFWCIQKIRNSLKSNEWYDDDHYIDYLDEILNQLVENQCISDKKLDEYKVKINIYNPQSLEECLCEYDRLTDIDDHINQKEEQRQVQLWLQDMWSELSEQEHDILQSRLMNDHQTLQQIANRWDCPRQTISLHENKLKQKLKENFLKKMSN